MVISYDLQDKKVFNLETEDDYEDDDDLETRARNLKSAVNKEYLNNKVLKKDKGSQYFDLRQKYRTIL